jgi:hypothetical protein
MTIRISCFRLENKLFVPLLCWPQWVCELSSWWLWMMSRLGT